MAQLSIQLLCPAHLAGLGVVGPRSGIPGFLRHFEPLVDLVQVAFRALAFGYVTMNDRDTHHVSARVSDRAGADPNLDQASVFAPPGRLEINLLALKDASQPLPSTLVRRVGSKQPQRLANRLGRRVAVELLSGRVPCLNSCVRVDAENSIHR